MKRIAATLVLLFAVTAIAQNYPPPGRPPQNDPWVYGPQNNNWTPDWNRRPNPRRGACVYTSRNFTGNHFCVRAGDRLGSLPSNFGDNISSIQVFGGARVTIFNDRNFRNGSTTLGVSVPDLRAVPFRGGHTWNNRVSSIIVS
jgi:hypothetical protein